MRRLVVEFSVEQFETSGQAMPKPLANLLEKVKSLEMLHVLKMVPGEFAGIVRIEFKDPESKVEDIFPSGGTQGSKMDTELLDRESDTVSTYFVKSSMRPDSGRAGLGGLMPYVVTPFEYRDGKLRVAFLGSLSQIRRVLAGLSKQSRVRYKVASLGDAKFPPNSPMGRLTDKQRRVLIAAYKLGYYDVPRKITAEELAERLDLVKSTFSAHIRKAERRLLTEMLREL